MDVEDDPIDFSIGIQLSVILKDPIPQWYRRASLAGVVVGFPPTASM
jgi:hypothetical protein